MFDPEIQKQENLTRISILDRDVRQVATSTN